MNVFELLDQVNEMVEEMISEMTKTNSSKLGLDYRASPVLWVDEDCIIVEKYHDRTLQYYGGFEYVNPEYRKDLGDYVIYLYGDDRVTECIDRFFRGGEDVEDEEE